MENIFITIMILIYSFFIFIVYLKKSKVKVFENIFFVFLLIIGIMCPTLECCSYVVLNSDYGSSSLIYEICNKFLLMFYMLGSLNICLYVFTSLNKIKNRQELFKLIFIKLYLFITLIAILFSLFVKISYLEIDGLVIPNGLSVEITYLYCALNWIIIFFIFASKKKNIFYKRSKYLPVFVSFLITIAIIIFQYFNPNYFLISFIYSFSVFVMYFTIENPDVKLIEYERKEIEKIRQTAESKSEFLSSTSHELRTPLNAIIGLSEDIESFKEINPEILDDVKDLINASNDLLDIISNILDSSKIESGKLDIIECNYDVKEEFETLGNIYKVKAFKKNLELNINIDDNVPQVLYGDRQRIKQVISNLLDNAVKFTDVGKINYLIKWDYSKNNLIITISDSGDGLNKEEVETFLNENNNLQIEKIYSAEGTGLGLTISRNLIKLLNGYASVETKIYAGTKFTIVIPQKIGSVETLKSINQNIEIDINSLNYIGKRILIVDDNPVNIKVLRKAIKSFNFVVEECYNGKDAIDKIEHNNNYDLIFMDIMMPIMNGEETIKKLKEMTNFNTPVVALTADAVNEATQKYKKMGFNDYMSKPFSRDMVINKLYSVLGRGEKNE